MLDTNTVVDCSLSVQAHGAIFGINKLTKQVNFVSKNACSFLGLSSPDQLLVRPPADTLGREVTHALRNIETLPTLSSRPQTVGVFDLAMCRCCLLAFSAENHLVVEAIPYGNDREPSASDVLNDVQVMTDSVVSSEHLDDLFGRLTAYLRTLSGYHCVVVECGRGMDKTKVAVSGRVSLADATCDAAHHLSYVADASQSAQCLVKASDEVIVPSLGLLTLQPVTEQTKSNMQSHDVAACATLGLNKGLQPWGAIKLLHQLPRTPNRRTQFALAHLLPVIEQRLNTLV